MNRKEWYTIFTLCMFVHLQTNKAQWVNHGGDLSNTRSRNIWTEPAINTALISNLHLRWKFITDGDVTATPSIADGTVYFPSWNGNLYAVNALTGQLVWKVNLSQLTGLPPPARNSINVTVSRTTPAVVGNMLIIGIYGPAVVLAINRFTTKLVWLTKLDPRPLAVITMSGTAYRGAFYVGVSSLETALPPTQCCTFRGSLVKLSIETGTIIWQTYTLPDNNGKLGGYAGGGVWGSSPSIDGSRNLVYIGSGQVYIAPASVLACQAEQNKQSSGPRVDCLGPDAHSNSIIAVDMRSGKIRWARRLGGYDVFYFVCLVPNNPACPPGPNLDSDFGEAPMLITIRERRGGRRRFRDVAVAAQKNGFVWALDRNDGSIVWFNQAGPGGLEGGAVWGAATDGRNIYTNIVNSESKPFKLTPSNRTTLGGGWVALDANTGEIKWTTANPTNDTSHGPVTVVNDLMFGGSVNPDGSLYALRTGDGRILWEYKTGGSLQGGASVGYGCVYVGSGVSSGLATFHPEWRRGNSVSALCVGMKRHS